MATVDAGLNKLIGRLDVVSKGIQNLSSKFNNFKLNATTFGIDELNINPKEKENTTEAATNNVTNEIELPNYSLDITLEWNQEYNEIFQKIENRAQEFEIQIEKIFDNIKELTVDISMDKLIGIEPDISGIAAGISNIFKKAIASIDWDKIFGPVRETICKAFGSVLESFKSVITTVSTEITMEYSVEVSESDDGDWLSKISEFIFKKLLSGKLLKKFKGVEILLLGGLIEGKDFLSKLIDSFALAKGGAGTLHESLAAVFGKSGGIASIVTGALLGVTNFVDMLKNGFSWVSELMMIIGTALAAVGAVILGASAGVAALVAAVVAGVATVVILVKDNWDAICAWFAGLGEWFSENVVTPVVEFFKGLWESVSSFFSSLWNDICQIWENLPEWFNENVIIPVVTFFDGLWETVSSLFSTLWQLISEIWEAASEWFNENVTTPIVTFFEELWETINGLFASLWENICEIWRTVSVWFSENVITPVVSFFEGFFMRVQQLFADLWIKIQAIWIIVSTWFNENVVTPVISLFEGIWTTVSGFFDGLWKDIKAVWQGVATWFDENVTQPIQNFFGSMWDGIKQGMISTMNAVIGGIENGINFIIRGINSIIGGFNRIVSWAAEVAEVEWGGVTPITEVSLDRIGKYETGGFPERASLFWANEYGVPELVGTVGNRTAVASGTEITGIADAVYSTGQAETSLLTAAVNLLQEIASKDMSINIGDREIARANYRGQKSLGTRLITEF